MKVALVLNGLPRNVKEGYEIYWKHIIENYDTDVYLHFWEDADWQDVLNVYNPTKFICQPPFPFTKYKENVTSVNDPMARPIKEYDVAGNFTSLPMFYSWQSGYNLIDKKYDCIVRSRFDLGWEVPMDLSKFDLNKINVTNHHWANSKIIDDNLLISNQQNCDLLLTDIFDTFCSIIQGDGLIHFAEQNFTNILIKKNLYQYIYKSNDLNFKLLREFKVWY
jgi:hypothetical protein